MEKEIVQVVIAGEVLCNALFDMSITEKDHVYIKQEGNHYPFLPDTRPCLVCNKF